MELNLSSRPYVSLCLFPLLLLGLVSGAVAQTPMEANGAADLGLPIIHPSDNPMAIGGTELDISSSGANSILTNPDIFDNDKVKNSRTLDVNGQSTSPVVTNNMGPVGAFTDMTHSRLGSELTNRISLSEKGIATAVWFGVEPAIGAAMAAAESSAQLGVVTRYLANQDRREQNLTAGEAGLVKELADRECVARIVRTRQVSPIIAASICDGDGVAPSVVNINNNTNRAIPERATSSMQVVSFLDNPDHPGHSELAPFISILGSPTRLVDVDDIRDTDVIFNRVIRQARLMGGLTAVGLVGHLQRLRRDWVRLFGDGLTQINAGGSRTSGGPGLEYLGSQRITWTPIKAEYCPRRDSSNDPAAACDPTVDPNFIKATPHQYFLRDRTMHVYNILMLVFKGYCDFRKTTSRNTFGKTYWTENTVPATNWWANGHFDTEKQRRLSYHGGRVKPEDLDPLFDMAVKELGLDFANPTTINCEASFDPHRSGGEANLTRIIQQKSIVGAFSRRHQFYLAYAERIAESHYYGMLEQLYKIVQRISGGGLRAETKARAIQAISRATDGRLDFDGKKGEIAQSIRALLDQGRGYVSSLRMRAAQSAPRVGTSGDGVGMSQLPMQANGL